MRHLRLTRLVKTAATLGSSLVLAGGMLLTTSGPASAEAGGVNVCNNFSGSADLSAAVPMITGTFTNCHQQGSGAFQGVLNINGALAPGDVFWATGHATSVVSFSAVIDLSGGPCPTGDIAAAVTIVVGGGPYATPPSATGGGELCADASAFPIIALSNFGPTTI